MHDPLSVLPAYAPIPKNSAPEPLSVQPEIIQSPQKPTRAAAKRQPEPEEDQGWENYDIPASAGDDNIIDSLKPMWKNSRPRGKLGKRIKGLLGAIVVIAAIAVLLITLWLPVFQVQRSSMAQTLRDGEVVVFITTGGINRGDVIAFNHGSHVLIKRVIAVSGDWVDILENGTVLLNGTPLIEPYVSEFSPGEISAEFPMQVPDRQYFVLGDRRQTSLDSRDEEIGLIRQDQIIGKSFLRVWPLDRIGTIK